MDDNTRPENPELDREDAELDRDGAEIVPGAEIEPDADLAQQRAALGRVLINPVLQTAW